MLINGLGWVRRCALVAAAFGLAACPNEEGSAGDASAEGNDVADTNVTATEEDSTGGGMDDGTTGGGATGSQADSTSAGDEEMPPVVFDVNGGQDGLGGAGLILDGFVWGPNGEIPVSGALVYTTNLEPEGIPQQVYCAECQELDATAHFTLSNPDGSFELPTAAGRDKYFVVRKGEFMRVSQIDIEESDTVNEIYTTLPGYNDPDNGLYIPLIAVGDGTYDRIEDALGKFGLGDTMISNFEERLVPGTESFDLYDNGQNPATDGFVSAGNFGQLVADPALLAQYHIIFIPCSTDPYLAALTNPTNMQNVRDWVAAGGRWYVADWSAEYLWEVFGEYQTFHGEPANTDLGSYDSLADVMDTGLLDWLQAIPDALKDINPLNDEPHPTLFQLPQVQTVDNWSGIQTINPVIVQDKDGNDVDVGYKVWLEGPGGGSIPAATTVPLTVTGQFGCGKIQFTSYHTAEFFDYVGLSPQELVLIYTILEIGVCQDPLPPPIPEG